MNALGNPSIKSCKRRPGNLPFLSMGRSCDTKFVQWFRTSILGGVDILCKDILAKDLGGSEEDHHHLRSKVLQS